MTEIKLDDTKKINEHALALWAAALETASAGTQDPRDQRQVALQIMVRSTLAVGCFHAFEATLDPIVVTNGIGLGLAAYLHRTPLREFVISQIITALGEALDIFDTANATPKGEA